MKIIKTLMLFVAFSFAVNGFAQSWTTNVNSAVKQSEKSGQPILVFMAYRADLKLKGLAAFNSKEFKEYAKDNLICLKIDMFYNAKTSSYQVKNNSNSKAAELFGNAYLAAWLYHPGDDKKKNLNIYTSTGITPDKLLEECKRFAEK